MSSPLLLVHDSFICRQILGIYALTLVRIVHFTLITENLFFFLSEPKNIYVLVIAYHIKCSITSKVYVVHLIDANKILPANWLLQNVCWMNAVVDEIFSREEIYSQLHLKWVTFPLFHIHRYCGVRFYDNLLQSLL